MFSVIVAIAVAASAPTVPTPPNPVPPSTTAQPPPAGPTTLPTDQTSASPIQPGNDATPVERGDSGDTVYAAQVLLSRAGFSSGVIDGHFGDLAISATKGFQESAGLESTGRVDAQTWAALQTNGNIPALVTVSVEPNIPLADGKLPRKPAAQAKLQALSYETLEEAVAEKYHTTPAALARLNPGVEIKEGATLRVPNVQAAWVHTPTAVAVPGNTAAVTAADQTWLTTLESLSVEPQQPTVAKLIVDKSDRFVRALDQSGRIIAQFPATIGSRKNPSPTGAHTLRGVSRNPIYNYDPEVIDKPGTKKFKLPPGPNNLVGVVWLDLSKENFGIHGTAEPSQIGSAASNGCIRLTNWDAAKLAQMVKPGTPVLFQP